MKGLSVRLFLFIGIAGVRGFTLPNSPACARGSAIPACSLFQQRSVEQGHVLSLDNKSLGRKCTNLKALRLRPLRLLGKFPRSFMILASSMLWLGAVGVKPPPAHASTAVVPASETRFVLSPSLEHIVDRYVKDHMFDDDVYDPIESIYREAISDKADASHPKALSEITSSVLGQDGMKVEKAPTSGGIGDWLMGAVSFLRRKGLSESTSIILLTGVLVIAGPITFLLGGMMVATQSKRQFKTTMKKRYGDAYTYVLSCLLLFVCFLRVFLGERHFTHFSSEIPRVDATVKSAEPIELPDDDEDDDDDEDTDAEGDVDDDDDE